MARPRTLPELRERYGTLTKRIAEENARSPWGDGGGDVTLNDIAFLFSVIDRQQEALEAVDRLLSDVMTQENLHIYEPVAARVTAALAEGRDSAT